MSKEKKVKLHATERLLLTAMPKSKKEAETVVKSLSEQVFAHVVYLVTYGEVRDTPHWMKEIATFSLRLSSFASNTTNKHLDPKWVLVHLFTDNAPDPLTLASYMDLHSSDKDYRPLSENFFHASLKTKSEIYAIVYKFYRDFSRDLTERGFIPQTDLYPKLLDLTIKAMEIHK